MEQFVAWLKQLEFDGVWQTAVLVLASILSITFHETCHGLVAWWQGDTTAKDQGRLTLNPLKHIDLFGLIMMALCRFGWAKPVPVNMRRFRNPKAGMALCAIAGPAANVVLALLAALLSSALMFFWLRGQQTWLLVILVFLEYVQIISAGLAVFNLFPIPPLDGSKVLFALLPTRIYVKLMRFERYGMIVLAALLLLGVLDTPLLFLRSGLLSGIGAVSRWPLKCMYQLFG